MGLKKEKISCPICLCGNLLNYENNLTLCIDCEHVFQSDLNISTIYDSNYAHQYDIRPHHEMSQIRWTFIQKALSLSPGSKILDVGYGNGSFLKHALNHDMDIYGIDVHGEEFGIPEVNYDTEMIFDLVCFFDSLEHFDTFEKPLSLNARNIIVSTPDPVDFLLIYPQKWRHFKPGEHLHYFSRKSLDLIMHRWGFFYKLAEGNPEDDLRGKLIIDNQNYNNIYTAIYSKYIGGVDNWRP